MGGSPVDFPGKIGRFGCCPPVFILPVYSLEPQKEVTLSLVRVLVPPQLPQPTPGTGYPLPSLLAAPGTRPGPGSSGERAPSNLGFQGLEVFQQLDLVPVKVKCLPMSPLLNSLVVIFPRGLVIIETMYSECSNLGKTPQLSTQRCAYSGIRFSVRNGKEYQLLE